jgi:hypothetical protein
VLVNLLAPLGNVRRQPAPVRWFISLKRRYVIMATSAPEAIELPPLLSPQTFGADGAAEPHSDPVGTLPAKRVAELVILIPVFRDWESASIVCELLDAQLGRLSGVQTRVVLVDDGSADRCHGWKDFPSQGGTRFEILKLMRNVGHQRAICLGLCYAHEHLSPDFVLVMDGDGEDAPDCALRLIEQMIEFRCPVFAERRKRMESLTFRGGYFLFRQLHRALTGISVRFGNFSIIDRATLTHLVCMPELWSHYAGALVKSKIPFRCIPIDRAMRLRGRSRMTMTSLIAHGIAGIATFHETVACRILIANGIVLGLLLAMLAAIIGIKLGTTWAIPGWTTLAVGLTSVLFTQLVAISFSLVFSLISSRGSASFLPRRDYRFYIESFGLMESTGHGA